MTGNVCEQCGFSRFTLCLLALAHLCSAVPAITWASFPVFPNETVLLQGSGFHESSANELAISISCLSNKLKSVVVKPLPDQTSAGSLKFIIPADFPVDAYSINVRSTPVLGNPSEQASNSNIFMLNTPELWWAQGDLGNASTPNGWVRIFGRSLTYPAESNWALNNMESASSGTDRLLSIHKAIGKAIKAGDRARVRQLASQLASVEGNATTESSSSLSSSSSACTLLLTHKETGAQVKVPATSSDGFSAHFQLAGAMGGPISGSGVGGRGMMPLGSYNISISNGPSLPFVALEFFESPGIGILTPLPPA
jgi:hypothetical protein